MPGWQRKNQVNETAVIKCLLKLKQKINSFITTVVKKIAISKKKKIHTIAMNRLAMNLK